MGSRPSTLCEAFERTVARVPERVALRTLDGSEQLTWREFDERVRRVAAGLRAAGLRPGDTLALMMGNRVEFHLLDVAAMRLGAIPFSMYGTSSPEQVAYLVENAGARLAIAEPALADRIPAKRVIDVGDIASLERNGRIGEFPAVAPDDLLTLIYTSGTTGPPKGVEISHANQIATAFGYDEMVGGFPDGAEVVSSLPMAHIAERNCSHYWAQAFGFTVTIVDDPAKLFDAVREVRPAWFFSVPRIYEKLRSMVADAPPEEAARTLGLDRVVAMLIGGTRVDTDLVRFFHDLGLPLGEIWGMSETTGIGTFNRPGREKLGTAGAPAPGVELRVAGDGEIEVRGACLSRGYRGRPDATAESRTDDCWLRTGDVGSIDEEGFLTILDRKKELIISSAGKNMSPSNIESAIKAATPLVGSAVAIGDARPFNVALLALDPDAAAAFARAHDIGQSDLAALAAHPVVIDAVARAVTRANDTLSRPEQIKRFRLLGAEWPPGGDELTPTMKLRRVPITEKYAEEIEALYA